MSDTQAEDQIEEEILEEPIEEELVSEDVTEDVAEEVPEEKPEEEETDVVVTIGEESPTPEETEHTQAPAWVKELRKNHRELQRKNRELEDKLKSTQAPKDDTVQLGQKPKLEDHDFDADKYEDELSKWYDRKRLVEDQTAKAEDKQKAADQAWQDKLNAYGDAKTKLKVNDYEEAEHVAQETLSKTQQGIILQGADNPALVVYALGKNQAKAKELAAINDPVKYAFAVAKLETQLKVTKRQAPQPEGTVVKGSAAISGSVDSTLERLRSEAAKTGNYTKVMQYKASKRSAK